MDPKYISLLCKVQDPAVKAILTSMLQDMEQQKPRLEVVGKPLSKKVGYTHLGYKIAD
ncbi:hypothetical protein JCM16163A_41230 [Paenibacillus sp. YK5]